MEGKKNELFKLMKEMQKKAVGDSI